MRNWLLVLTPVNLILTDAIVWSVRPHQALAYKTPTQFLEEFALARSRCQ